MKIAVVSDSHDNKDNLEKVATIANENHCSYLFHLGDFVSPYTASSLNTFNGIVKAVYGNCDGEKLELQKTIITIGGEIEKPPFKFKLDGKIFILMHEPYQLEDLIESQEADFIFYGHLHKIDVRKEGKTHVLNPGESGGKVRKPSFFIVDTQDLSFEKKLI
jgi:putative phosphoesterase